MTAAERPVVIVGGGPAGLACAIELRRRGGADVVVLEREAQAGGIPRHSSHQGFGVRDLHRVMSGPRYARGYAERARNSGVRIESETMVTGWSHSGELEVTSPSGRRRLAPAAVVLATGCRERPRAARLVAGSRPEGVMTTGTLQQLVYLARERIGGRALIVGAEHVSFSALVTLAHGGAKVTGMVTELPRQQSLTVVRAAAVARYRAPLWTRTGLRAIHGYPRVEEAELEDLDSGATRSVGCETVVFTADWIPDHELAVMAGLQLDAGTRGPRIDTALRTGRPGLFAAGNVLQGAEPADVAALSGRHAAASVARWLSDASSWPERTVPIVCRPPLHWISPNAIGPDSHAPPRGRFALRSRSFLRKPELEISQNGRVLWRGRLSGLQPGRSAGLTPSWLTLVDAAGDAVEVTVKAALRS